jgi:hypothetical protein
MDRCKNNRQPMSVGSAFAVLGIGLAASILIMPGVALLTKVAWIAWLWGWQLVP